MQILEPEVVCDWDLGPSDAHLAEVPGETYHPIARNDSGKNPRSMGKVPDKRELVTIRKFRHCEANVDVFILSP